MLLKKPFLYNNVFFFFSYKNYLLLLLFSSATSIKIVQYILILSVDSSDTIDKHDTIELNISQKTIN